MAARSAETTGQECDGMTSTSTACSCQECKAMCERRPCWPTPSDARRLIDAGYASDLMLDWWFNTAANRTVYVLTPAIVGRESGQAPAIPSGRCTFFDEDGLCQLHMLNLKPTEGKQALCEDRTPQGLHERIAGTWDTLEGRDLIDDWERNPPRGRCLPLQRRSTRKQEGVKLRPNGRP